MKNCVYLGDIDPNNNIIPAMQIRREIMFQLLIWDKIIVSDSQFLTDPRVNVLMRGYNSDEIVTKYKVHDIDDGLKGIESLFENGLIEVAIRKNDSTDLQLTDIWESMRKSEKEVPYLPSDRNYVEYIQSLNCNIHRYKTCDMSSRFRENLGRGIETDPKKGGIILQNNEVEQSLKKMFISKTPYFRDMLDYLRKQRGDFKLSQERYQQLYDFIYSCYNINVSSELGCTLNTKYRHIPLHLQTSEEYSGESITLEQVEKLRPTWAFNPVFLDLMSFDDLVYIRKKLKANKVREFYINSINSPWSEINAEWDDYTQRLEDTIKLIMYDKHNELVNKIFKEFGVDKFLANPKLYTAMTPISNISKSVLSNVPVLSTVLSITDGGMCFWDSVISFVRRNDTIKLAEGFNMMSGLVSKESRVITKYGKK